MTRDQAIERALEYARANSLALGPVVDVKYHVIGDLDAKARQCPPELIETYRSVRESFRNHWAVAFSTSNSSGQVSCPGSRLVCVFDTGEVSLFSSP